MSRQGVDTDGQGPSQLATGPCLGSRAKDASDARTVSRLGLIAHRTSRRFEVFTVRLNLLPQQESQYALAPNSPPGFELFALAIFF